MRPSLANLGKGNPPHFFSLRSEVTNFFNRNCMELCTVVDSTVNHFHYEDDTAIIWMVLSIDANILSMLYVGFSA